MEILRYLLLFVAAIFPAVLYMFYTMSFDRQKPEPPKALITAALLGMLSAAAVIVLGEPFHLGELRIKPDCNWKEALEIGLLRLALPAEIVKWMVLFIFLSLNKYYDEYIDSIVYAVCLAMGFAGVWGAFFLWSMINESFETFMEVGVVTAFLFIPLHLITGTVMGYYFAQVKKENKTMSLAIALLLPIAVNALVYILAMMIGNHWEYYLVMDILLVMLGMFFYSQVFKLLKMDGIDIKRV